MPDKIEIPQDIVDIHDAAQTQEVGGRCVFCGKKVYYFEGDRAFMRGQIYSQSGVDEFRISSICEYCFDETTATAEDEPELFDHYMTLKAQEVTDS